MDDFSPNIHKVYLVMPPTAVTQQKTTRSSRLCPGKNRALYGARCGLDSLSCASWTFTEIAVLIAFLDQSKPRLDPGTVAVKRLRLDDNNRFVISIDLHIRGNAHVRKKFPDIFRCIIHSEAFLHLQSQLINSKYNDSLLIMN